MKLLIRTGVATSFALAWLAMTVSSVSAQQDLNIQIQNNQTDGGFFLTPLWFGIHNGSFDFFDGNNTGSASAGLELIAEEGDASLLSAEFATAVPTGQQGVILSPGGFSGAPVIDPGEIAMTTVTVADTMSNRFFSFASMVIPSNDAFIGNAGAMDYELFDAMGNFNGPITIEIFGSSIFDAGTEVNDPFGGAAFSANGGTSSTENLFVRVHSGLSDFVGTFTVAGTEITSDIGSGELLATISIGAAVPEPGSMSLLGIAAGYMAIRRRRRV